MHFIAINIVDRRKVFIVFMLQKYNLQSFSVDRYHPLVVTKIAFNKYGYYHMFRKTPWQN